MSRASAPVAAAGTVSHLSVALMVGGASAYATTPTFGKLAFGHDVNPLGFLVVRFPTAAIVLAVLMALRGRPLRRGLYSRRVMLVSALFFVQTFSFFSALRRMDAGPAVLILYLYPALVTGWGVIGLGERLSRRTAVALPMSLVGVVLSSGLTGHANLAGVGFATLSACLYATYFVLAKDLLTNHAEPLELVGAIYMGVATAYCVAALASGDVHVPNDSSGWWYLAASVVLGTVVAPLLTLNGLRRLLASAAAMLATFEPIAAVLFAAAVLGEHLVPVQIAGAALVIAALLLLATGRPQPQETYSAEI